MTGTVRESAPAPPCDQPRCRPFATILRKQGFKVRIAAFLFLEPSPSSVSCLIRHRRQMRAVPDAPDTPVIARTQAGRGHADGMPGTRRSRAGDCNASLAMTASRAGHREDLRRQARGRGDLPCDRAFLRPQADSRWQSHTCGILRPMTDVRIALLFQPDIAPEGSTADDGVKRPMLTGAA